MAFVTKKSGENPLAQVEDNIYEAEVTGFEEVENRFKGQLFNPNQPESENNRRNNYDSQYEFTFRLEGTGLESDPEPKVWANPTLGERSKLRKIIKALGAWIEAADSPTGEEGFDDDPDNIIGRKVKIVVQDGSIEGFLKG